MRLVSVLRNIGELSRYRLTPSGSVLIIAVIGAEICASVTLAAPIYHLFVTLLALYVISFCSGIVFKPRVTFTGSLPDRVRAGEEFTARFRVLNLSRFPCFDLGIGFFGAAPFLEPGEARLLHFLPPHGEGTLSIASRIRRRGLHRLPPLRPFTVFPCNTYRIGGNAVRRHAVLATPSFRPLDSLSLPAGRRYQPGGVLLSSRLGESPEYMGSRDYQPGEPNPKFDFRSWARLASPVVKEFQEEYYCRLALLLDTWVRRPAFGRPYEELEAAVSLAAAVAEYLSRGEYIVDFLAAGPKLYTFRSGRSIGQFEHILEILACVQGVRANPFPVLLPALLDKRETISAAVCIFLDWDAERELAVRSLREAGASITTIILREGPTTTAVPASASPDGDIRFLRPAAVLAGEVDRL